jgi:predicted O-linked N-acetylglucosamine transferase (SPINDLY family)
LGGFTQGARISVFAMRAAPIQMSYIGYLGTLGTDYFDYLIADSTLIPQDKQQHYSEKIIYLPTYQVNDNKREVSDKIFTREEAGLPPTGFIFCCFNNNYKILPSTFDGWMRILKAVDNSVLWLLDTNDTATKNLRNQAISNGIDGDRIIFGKHIPQPEYLARYRTADLFLDTIPYNAGTTASDALRMGLPLLTLMGESFASRYAASILNAVNLPELITETQEQYEALAIELAQNHEQFSQIKNKLINNLPTTPLFNTKCFARNIEAAYREAYKRYQGNLAADHIYIENSHQP